MGTVMLICGKICSGKTWYASQLKQEKNAVILSTDEVTWDLTGNEQGQGYDAFAKRVNSYLMKKAAEIAAAGCNVILDWGFWTAADRQAASAYFRSRQIPVEWHYIDVDDAVWFSNIAARNERIRQGNGGSDFYVDEGLLEKLLSKFEPPERSEIQVWHTVKKRPPA